MKSAPSMGPRSSHLETIEKAGKETKGDTGGPDEKMQIQTKRSMSVKDK